eukprot:6204743-Pleurochrysis_carterae.AAC.2
MAIAQSHSVPLCSDLGVQVHAAFDLAACKHIKRHDSGGTNSGKSRGRADDKHVPMLGLYIDRSDILIFLVDIGWKGELPSAFPSVYKKAKLPNTTSPRKKLSGMQSEAISQHAMA